MICLGGARLNFGLFFFFLIGKKNAAMGFGTHVPPYFFIFTKWVRCVSPDDLLDVSFFSLVLAFRLNSGVLLFLRYSGCKTSQMRPDQFISNHVVVDLNTVSTTMAKQLHVVRTSNSATCRVFISC